MSDNNPEQIKRDIEQTRSELSDNVNALSDKVSPSHIAGRQADRARSAITGLKEHVMGSDDEGGTMPSTASDTVSTGVEAAKSAPSAVRRKARGNPLAAGLIAFGVGWLASSILPASDAEQQLAGQAKDKAADVAEPVVQQVKEAGQEMADNLKQPAREAVEQVRSSAQDAAGNVSDQTKDAARDVKDEATEQAKH